LLYLLLTLAGIFTVMVVPSHTIVPGDAAATLALANRYSFPALLGEIVFTLWLLVIGAKPWRPALVMA
jgi:hypothetical protein